MAVFDDSRHERTDQSLGPEAQLMQQQAIDQVRAAIEQLPDDFRDVVVLRELEGFSYKEIAGIVGIPIGTVMSRLARGRDRLSALLGPEVGQRSPQ
jgi:RNA polymerase sigma-70 factor (ECF subfamily)